MIVKLKSHHSIRRYYAEFAEKFEIVGFGDIRKNDDVKSYRGVTFSPSSKDTNFHHGTVNGYDLSSFTRKSTHALPSSGSIVSEWTIMALHLKQGGFPHIVVDTRKHDKEFYQSVFTRFPKLRRAGSVLMNLNPGAINYFDLYIAPESTLTVQRILDDTILQRMIMNYPKYNIEIDSDTLYLFSRDKPISAKQLSDMLEEALWLAETVELKNAYTS